MQNNKVDLFLSIAAFILLVPGCGPSNTNDLPQTTALAEEGASDLFEPFESLKVEDPTLRSDEIVLLVYTSWGLRPPQFQGWGRKTTVFVDGRVVKSVRDNGLAPWQDTLVKTLTAQEISGLMATTSPLAAGKLVFPDREGCTCAPGTSYWGRDHNGELIEFAASSNCLSGLLESFPPAEELRSVLGSF